MSGASSQTYLVSDDASDERGVSASRRNALCNYRERARAPSTQAGQCRPSVICPRHRRSCSIVSCHNLIIGYTHTHFDMVKTHVRDGLLQSRAARCAQLCVRRVRRRATVTLTTQDQRSQGPRSTISTPRIKDHSSCFWFFSFFCFFVSFFLPLPSLDSQDRRNSVIS